MVKRRNPKKAVQSSAKTTSNCSPKEISSDKVFNDCHSIHTFQGDEVKEFRRDLLQWYDKNKRVLPWRTTASTETDPNIRAYAVLVSEIMLQQTQVATVLAYYEKWMTRWPTLTDLAGATAEQVNEMWAGLGYYSRGRRLHEIACKIDSDLQGNMPSSASELLKLPGVGPYTAGAVSSIAFSEKSAVVDGNVIRVLARIKAIGACTTTPTVTKMIWELAEQLVDPKRPGDLNQSLMELGATVCTPKNPQCDSCPLSKVCLAFKKARKTASRTELADIEEVPGCGLCLSSHKWDASLGVMNYPRKEKKTNVSQQETAVCILYRQAEQGLEFFMEKRPKDGLLANLWQFPSLLLPLGLSDAKIVETTQSRLDESYDVSNCSPRMIGRVPHQFSHISQVYVVLSLKLSKDSEPITPAQAKQWVLHKDINDLAIPTGMKKVFKLFNAEDKIKSPAAKKRKISITPEVASKSNTLLTDFFKTAKKESK